MYAAQLSSIGLFYSPSWSILSGLVFTWVFILEVIDHFWHSKDGICLHMPLSYQNWLMILVSAGSLEGRHIFDRVVYVIFLHYRCMVGVEIICVCPTTYPWWPVTYCHSLVISIRQCYWKQPLFGVILCIWSHPCPLCVIVLHLEIGWCGDWSYVFKSEN